MPSMVNIKVNNGQYGKCEVNNGQYGKYKREQWPVW